MEKRGTPFLVVRKTLNFFISLRDKNVKQQIQMLQFPHLYKRKQNHYYFTQHKTDSLINIFLIIEKMYMYPKIFLIFHPPPHAQQLILNSILPRKFWLSTEQMNVLVLVRRKQVRIAIKTFKKYYIDTIFLFSGMLILFEGTPQLENVKTSLKS